ncbi:helix-turn-helix domain-containing protein [Sphingopyxis panaciterrulae]|uniref:IclR family mhp operon transcriptional activator n=1 Tax=Sphingopyxis panaciterrulae TaxID=462372 RepID=A0A7W9B9P4_9SPHN|nr:helix-turn-helix domain-containing protein [Sphingopyxis panaciterrulae]MBB5708651.1 IclR family mhp operon transcriptional activator [Sphingopyxis panaciterrulae]
MTAGSDLERGIPIRSISRAIAVLQAINRGGSLTMMEIARASAVPYPTACRIVQTLLHEGLVERESARKRYQPTALVQTLAHGFQGHGALVEATRPHIAALTRDIGWPISLTTHVGSSMVIRDSTHAQTSLTFNAYYPGYAVPILDCAAGHVYLAYAREEERESLLDSLARLGDRDTHHMLQLVREGGVIETVRASGHAARGFNRFTQNPGKTSSIAVPLFRDDAIAGALTLAFFSSAIQIDEAIRQFLPKLQACAAAITEDLKTGADDRIRR